MYKFENYGQIKYCHCHCHLNLWPTIDLFIHVFITCRTKKLKLINMVEILIEWFWKYEYVVNLRQTDCLPAPSNHHWLPDSFHPPASPLLAFWDAWLNQDCICICICNIALRCLIEQRLLNSGVWIPSIGKLARVWRKKADSSINYFTLKLKFENALFGHIE